MKAPGTHYFEEKIKYLKCDLRDLKENDISSPYLDETRSGKKRYKILKVTNRYDEHRADYSKDFSRIKDLALKEKQINIVQKWLEEKIINTYSRVCILYDVGTNPGFGYSYRR